MGVQPNPAFWGGKAEDIVSADQVSWLGRPDNDGPGAMGRSGSQGFFRLPYDFAEDGKGIVGVPIPVWTTKSFNASWESALAKIPFEAKLLYHTRFENKTVMLSGTSVASRLPSLRLGLTMGTSSAPTRAACGWPTSRLRRDWK